MLPLSRKKVGLSLGVDRLRVCGKDAPKWKVWITDWNLSSLRDFDRGEEIGLVFWGLDRCCFKVRKCGLLFSFSQEDVMRE